MIRVSILININSINIEKFYYKLKLVCRRITQIFRLVKIIETNQNGMLKHFV